MAKEIFTATGLTKITDGNGKIHITGRLRIDWSHRIFSGHFPDNPVLPGVVQIQMVTDVCDRALGMEFVLTRASNIKYLNMAVPEICDELSADITLQQTGFDHILVATLFHGEYIFLKLKGLLTPASSIPHQNKS